MYTKEEALKASLEYFEGDDLASRVFVEKYALQGESEGDFYESTPEEMHLRLAKEYHRIEQNYPNPTPEEDILKMLLGKRIVPGGSQLFGIGNRYQLTSLNNCFVVNNENDSYCSIMRLDEELVQIAKRRGGVGMDISHLRPEGAPVGGGARSSTGAVSFCNRFSHSVREVAQNGRRGALMLSMDVKHPDAHLFRDLKTDKTTCTGANISLKFSDAFMEAVSKNEDYVQSFPVTAPDLNHEQIKSLEHGRLIKINGAYYRKIRAYAFWEKFIKNAHQHAEPGALFWDTIKEGSLSDLYDGSEVVSTNPCGEIPLPPYGACNLMAVNVSNFIINPFGESPHVDYVELKKAVKMAQRLLDDAIDLELEATQRIIDNIKCKRDEEVEVRLWEKIQNRLRGERRTGLGVVGYADAVAKMNLRYDSMEGIELMESIQYVISQNSYGESVKMAKERGAFGYYDFFKESSHPFISKMIYESPSEELVETYRLYGRRNISNLTLAPTGTISLIAQTTSGIEPVFELVYKRRRRATGDAYTFMDANGDKWEEYRVVHKGLRDYLSITQNKKIEDLTDKELEELCRTSPYVTSSEVNYKQKVMLQSALQQYIDHSISVTHNLPKNVTEQEVSDLFRMSWSNFCKGCTVYREGSRDGVLLKDSVVEINAEKRPEKLLCDVHLTTCTVGKEREDWVVLVGVHKNKPYEIFAIPAKNLNDEQNKKVESAKRANKQMFIEKKKEKKDGVIIKKYNLITPDELLIADVVAALDENRGDTKRISLELRHNIPLRFVVIVIEKTMEPIHSFTKAVSRVLKRYIKEGEVGGNCERCGGKLVFEGTCFTCRECGLSKCG
jgi:ribonucleoside-diphosphate reductase alpha chain